MGKSKIELDHDGIGAILRSLRGPVTRVAAQVAAAVDVPDNVPVLVRPYTTDRAAAAVTIAHPSGAAEQAKNGALTRAAARVGLEVTSRG